MLSVLMRLRRRPKRWRHGLHRGLQCSVPRLLRT